MIQQQDEQLEDETVEEKSTTHSKAKQWDLVWGYSDEAESTSSSQDFDPIWGSGL